MYRISSKYIFVAIVMALSLSASYAYAQTISLDLGPTGGATERALQLIALVTILSLAPACLAPSLCTSDLGFY